MPSIIQTPTPNLTASLDFYTKLNFKVLSKENPTLVSDGKVIIEINPNRFARTGVKLFRNSWTTIVEQLENLTEVSKTEEGYLLSDPSGTRIYLIETDTPAVYDLKDISGAVLGNSAGMSLETTAIHKSIEIWETLGFKKTMGGLEQGWIVFTNADDLSLSLMQPNSCPHLFFNPSLTYFNGKENPAIIAKIRSLKIPITEEITAFNKEGIVDNIIIRDPGGYGFFIFSD